MQLKMLERFRDYYNQQEGQMYPCSNQIVRCAIVVSDKDKAESIMKEKGAVKVLEQSYGIDWNLGNEQWIWRKWGESSRGFRFYKLILDKNVDDDLYLDVIRHCCANYCCSVELVQISKGDQ